MVYTLAKGRVTEEFERWVLWHLPLSRALIYHHCALRASGRWTVKSNAKLDDKLLRTSGAVQTAMAQAEAEEVYEEEDDFD